jgi:gamma-glutamyl-gamma-aminobutyrate hydrolase PuuD
MAPVIGITASELVATYGGVWKERSSLVPAEYVHAVARAGGVPVVLPAAGAAEAVVGRIDGLMLTGGSDLDPALFGAEAHPEALRPDRARDQFEIGLLEAAAASGLPVLAICRGIQVVNVWRGGTLHQHLPDIGADPDHLGEPGVYGSHRVRVEPSSRLGAILGAPVLDVPTHHHQAVDRIGAGLRASGWSGDGIVEALEDPDARYLVAVQWHPEMGDDPSLFESLVAAARPTSDT